MINTIYKKHKELWKENRGTMVLIALLTMVIAGLVSSIPVIGALAAALVVVPVISAATYKAYQSEEPLSVGLILEHAKDNITMDIISMQWSLTWRLFLWGLVPVYGIVKFYQYKRAFYIKLDDPEMTNTECIRASRDDMKGHKWNYFVKTLILALPLFLAIIVLTILLVPLIIATSASSSDLGITAGLMGIFGIVGIFGIAFTVLSLYYSAKLNHFELVANDEMEKERRV